MTDNTVRGRFVWHELITPNGAGAHEFYGKTLGWKKQSWEQDASYQMFAAASGPLGATVEKRDAVPHWLPYIGTTVVLGSPGFARALTRLASGGNFVNLELHGIDLADAEGDGLGWLTSHQPDLRRTAAQKEACLREAFSELARRGFSFVTLAQAAQRL